MKGCFLLSVLIVLISCQQNESPNSLPQIDFTELYDSDPAKVPLSRIGVSLEYIKLQTDSLSILSNVNGEDVKFFENFILVKDDRSNLLKFDLSGNFLNRIGAIGKGPGEYIDIDDFTVLTQDSLIVLNNRLESKFMFYDYNGNYISQKKLDFQTENLYEFNNYIVGVNSFLFRSYSNFNTFSIFDKKGNLKTQLLYKTDEDYLNKHKDSRVFWGFQTKNRSIHKLDDNLIYWENSLYSGLDTLYEVDQNLKVKPKMIFKFGGIKPDISDFYEKLSVLNSDFGDYSSILSLLQTDSYSFFKIFSGEKNKVQFIFQDKKRDDELVKIGYRRPLARGYYFAFSNDIDQGLPFWPDGHFGQNKLFKIIYGYKVEEYLKSLENNDLVDNTDSFNSLKNQFADSDISANPILMILTLR